jgi:hypothetical protein
MIRVHGNIKQGGIKMEDEIGVPKNQPKKEQPKKEPVDKEPVVKEQSKKESRRGVVSGCNFLAVRKSPSTSSEMVSVLHADNEVKIDHEKSTGEFYKIEAKGDIVGFCMKKYIRV